MEKVSDDIIVVLESSDSNASEDIQAMINSVLKTLANTAEETINSQHDMEFFISQIDMETEDNNGFGKSNDTTAIPESKKTNGTEDIPDLINSTESND